MNDFESVSEFFKTISDTNRLRILLMLDVRPLCVCEIDAVLDIAISTTSSHLKLMKSAGFIKSKKDGRWVIYYLAENEILTEMLLKTKELLKNDIQYLSDIEKINSISRESCKIR